MSSNSYIAVHIASVKLAYSVVGQYKSIGPLFTAAKYGKGVGIDVAVIIVVLKPIGLPVNGAMLCMLH